MNERIDKYARISHRSIERLAFQCYIAGQEGRSSEYIKILVLDVLESSKKRKKGIIEATEHTTLKDPPWLLPNTPITHRGRKTY